MQHSHGSCPSGLHDTALSSQEEQQHQQEREQQREQAWGMGSFLLNKEEDGLGAEGPFPRPQSTPIVSTPHNTSASTNSTANSRESALHTLVQQSAGPSQQEPSALGTSWPQAPAPLAPSQPAGRSPPGQGGSPLFLLQKEAERHRSISTGTASSPAVAGVGASLQRGPAPAPAPFSQPSISTSSSLTAASPFAPSSHSVSSSLLPEGTDASVSSSLYVKNLPPEATELLLYQHFAPHGAILSCKVLTDQETGRCRGVGFVNYVDSASAVRAAQLVHGTRIAEGRQVHVSLQAPRAVRTAAAAAASAQPSTQQPSTQPQPQQPHQRPVQPLLPSQHPLPTPLQPQQPLASSLLGMQHPLRGLQESSQHAPTPAGPHAVPPATASLARGPSGSGTVLSSPATAPSVSRAASGALLQGSPFTHPFAGLDVLHLPGQPQLAGQLSATPHGQLSPLASFHQTPQMPFQFMSFSDESGYAIGLQQPNSAPTLGAGGPEVVEQPYLIPNPMTGLSEPSLRRGPSNSGTLRPMQRTMSKPQFSGPIQPQFSSPIQPQFSAPIQAQPLEASPFSQGAFGTLLGSEDPLAAFSALSLAPAPRQQPPHHQHHHMF